MQREHEETWVKVNARADLAIAPIVSLLNEIEGIQTLDSCQGTPGKNPAHVYFYYGDWRNICRFVFEELGPKLTEQIANRGVASVEVFNGSTPMGKLEFDPEATDMVASVIGLLVKSAHNSECSYGKQYREPRSC